VTKMKLIVAIVQDYDCDSLLNAVTESHFRATRIASTGGFLRTGNTTVLLGVQDDEVAECLDVINRCCKARIERRSDDFGGDIGEWSAGGVCEVTIGGAITFVLSVESFVRIPVAPPVEI
jgi:uncharacterized protein YaaQ